MSRDEVSGKMKKYQRNFMCIARSIGIGIGEDSNVFVHYSFGISASPVPDDVKLKPNLFIHL